MRMMPPIRSTRFTAKAKRGVKNLGLWLKNCNQSVPTGPTVIFLHIPKTAGTSLQALIRRQFRPDLVFETDSNDPRETMREFPRLPEHDREKFRVILGHLWFGLHRAIPRPSTYITVLRHPVERIISHYYYVKRTPAHYLYREVTGKHLGLEAYVAGGLSTELNNGQTRLLSGEYDDERFPFGCCPDELLLKAKQHLAAHFSVVGIKERFGETLQLTGRVFNWKIADIHKNVTENRPGLGDIPPGVIGTISAYNRLDLELYEYGKEIFSRMLHEYRI